MVQEKTFVLWLVIMAICLTGCASTKVNPDHPLVQRIPDAPHARVYFLRPYPERSMGVADNKISVELDQQHLLELVKGEYALAQLKAGPVWITVRSKTVWGPRGEIKQMTNSRKFTFRAGKTYFVVFTPFDGEFRGVYFTPESVDLSAAKHIAEHLRPVGKARKSPIRLLGG